MSTSKFDNILEEMSMRLSGVTYVARKTKKPRYIAAGIVLIIILLVAALTVLSAYKAWKLLHPQAKELQVFSSNIVPEYSDVNFTAADKAAKLSGWYFKAKASDRTIIMVHSYGQNRMQFGEDTINLIKELLAKDYNVLAFDLRSSGKSSGKLSTFGCTEKDDVTAAVKWTMAQGASHIALMGFSTGASASILAAEDNKYIEAVIADSPYSDFKGYMKSNLNKWSSLPSFPFNRTVLLAMEMLIGIDADKASPADSIKKSINYRLLLIHGRNNKLIGIENSRELLKAAGKSAELWETDSSNAVSSYMDMPGEYTEKILNFLAAEK